MKALRWILFSLLAFGLGTGIAFALHPPTIGIPSATASGLTTDLEKIQEYAAEGRCNPVRGRLNGAASKIDRLPARTSPATVDKLTAALEAVRTQALTTCQQVSQERLAQERREQEAREALEPTTPTPAPTPEAVAPSTPEPAPEPTPDPGTGVPTTPQDQPGGDDDDGATGGVTIPGEEAVRQRIDKERRRIEKQAAKQADKVRKAWGQ